MRSLMTQHGLIEESPHGKNCRKKEDKAQVGLKQDDSSRESRIEEELDACRHQREELRVERIYAEGYQLKLVFGEPGFREIEC